jgi:hypothetical protein
VKVGRGHGGWGWGERESWGCGKDELTGGRMIGVGLKELLDWLSGFFCWVGLLRLVFNGCFIGDCILLELLFTAGFVLTTTGLTSCP